MANEAAKLAHGEVAASPLRTSQQPTVGEWKGKAILTLNPGAKWPFSFGIAKARMIIENIESIRDFVENGEVPVAQRGEDKDVEDALESGRRF